MSKAPEPGIVEELIAFADTMRGVNRYYMTGQTTYEREMLLRRAAARLAGFEAAVAWNTRAGATR